MEKMPITAQGLADAEKELYELKYVERPKVTEQIADAREHGDLKENAEYHAAREKQSFNEGRMKEIENCIANAEVIDPSTLSGDTVKFGATVNVVDADTEEEKTYQIVGVYEADLNKGKISFKSPLARALIGKREGDETEFAAPGGVRVYEILSVLYK